MGSVNGEGMFIFYTFFIFVFINLFTTIEIVTIYGLS